jgi:hypothetical protein
MVAEEAFLLKEGGIRFPTIVAYNYRIVMPIHPVQ